MKKTLFLLLLLSYAFSSPAQTCKIKIYYDANGNRTQRILECLPGSFGPDKTMAATSKQGNFFGDITTGTYQVYPIPAENKVSVRLDATLLEKGCDIVMIDISGKMIFQQKNIQQTISEINLQGLTDGAYMIQIISGADRRTVKIVKQTGNGY